MKLLKNICPYLVVIVLSFWTIKPLFNNGYFTMHDDTQPARVFEMSQALKDGQFPVRWVKDLGYGFGYPLFNFYSPLPYYIGSGFMFLGLDEILSAKIMIGIGLLLSGISMYLLGQYLWGKAGGLISATLYLYAPYHAIQVYVRGAIGELYAYALLPFIFYFLFNKKLNFNLRLVGGGIAWAGLVLSHNISAMLTIIFLGLWILYLLIISKNNTEKFSEIKLTGIIFLFGLSLSAFFWLPALVEAKYTQVDLLITGGSDFRQHFLFLQQLWDSPWGYAGSAPGLADGMSFKIGKIHLLVGLIAVGFLIFRKSAANRKLLYFLIPTSLIALWLMFGSSLMVWELIKPMAYVQYPWRLLVFLLFFLTITGGGIMQLVKNRKFRIGMTLAVLGLLIFVNYKYFTPQELFQPETGAYSSTEKLNWELSKISDEYMSADFIRPESLRELPSLNRLNNAIIIEQEIRSHRQKLIVESDVATLFQFKLADFPGWKVVVDESETEPTKADGILYTELSPGRHLLTAYLSDTPARKFGNLVSLLSLVGIFGILISINKKYYYAL